MNREEHGRMRRGRLSGSMARGLMSGSYRVWNRLLRDLRNPVPFYSHTGPNVPEPLRWGSMHEPRARALWWEKHPTLDLENPVCVECHDGHNDLWRRHVVASPDGVIYDPRQKRFVAGFELKCPYLQEKHQQWLADRVCPAEHYDQCAFGQLVTNLPQWVFCSFDPREEDEERQLFEILVAAPESYLEKMRDYGTRLLEMLETGEDFKPTTKTAQRFQEMFK